MRTPAELVAEHDDEVASWPPLPDEVRADLARVLAAAQAGEAA